MVGPLPTVLWFPPMRRRVKQLEEFDLTEEELLAAPLRLLTPEQRQRRKKIRTARAAKRRKAAREQRMAEGRAKVIFCQGFTRKGDACGAYALTGAKHCLAHLNDAEKARLGKKSLGEYARENRLKAIERNGSKVTAPQMARDIFEEALSKVFSRYFLAIGMEFRGIDDDGRPIVYDKGAEHGLCLYGESKEGDIHVSEYPDLQAQIQVLEKLWDRIYGRPKQTNVLEGGTKPIQVQPVRTVERAQQMAGLLRQSGAFPHEGRRRSQATEPASDSQHDTSPPDNVVPLNDTET